MHGEDTAEIRDKARAALDKIITRPTSIKNKRKNIPINLYLNGLYDYLNAITKHLRTKLRKAGPARNNVSLYEIDPRLKEINENNLLEDLRGRTWRQVTDTFLAEFLGLSVQGLQQKLKEESRP